MTGKMICLLKKIPIFSKKKPTYQVHLSESLNCFLKEKLSNNKDSFLVIDLKRNKDGSCQILTGIFPPPSGYICIKVNDIPMALSPSAYLPLDGCYMDIDSKNNILVFPKVEVWVQKTPNPRILRFVSNKNIISPKSQYSFAAWDREDNYKKPYLVKLLFQYQFVHSIYIEKNFIQVEIQERIDWKDYEEIVLNCIVNYLESLPEPILLINFGSNKSSSSSKQSFPT